MKVNVLTEFTYNQYANECHKEVVANIKIRDCDSDMLVRLGALVGKSIEIFIAREVGK